MNKELKEKAVKEALRVRENAYAPYSNFKVGAAIVTKSGKIYTGCNVENSSYGATVCAERIALFSAVADGEKEFEAIVIASDLNGEAAYPCGLCRQVIGDFSRNITVILLNSTTLKIEKEIPFEEIFPHAFDF